MDNHRARQETREEGYGKESCGPVRLAEEPLWLIITAQQGLFELRPDGYVSIETQYTSFVLPTRTLSLSPRC